MGASSWQLALVNTLLHVDDTERVNFDFCQVGMTTTSTKGEYLTAKKLTLVLTNLQNNVEVILLA